MRISPYQELHFLESISKILVLRSVGILIHGSYIANLTDESYTPANTITVQHRRTVCNR